MFKRFFVSFLMIFCLTISLTSCGKNSDSNSTLPIESTSLSTDELVTQKLTADELSAFLQTLNCQLGTKYEVVISSVYADGKTTSSEQIVEFDGDEIFASVEVNGDANYKAYVYNEVIYYEDENEKTYSFIESCKNNPNLKHGKIFRAMDSFIRPGSSDEYFIYDGSFFCSIRDAFNLRVGSDENVFVGEDRFEIYKIFNATQLMIKITYSPISGESTTYLLSFENNSLSEIKISFESAEKSGTATIKPSNKNFKFPDFELFVSGDVSNEKVYA